VKIGGDRLFAPEVKLHHYDAFVRRTLGAKALVAHMVVVRYNTTLTLQCFDGNVVWQWSTWGPDRIADFFGVDRPKFRDLDRKNETYDQWDIAKYRYYQEYFEPHFQKLLEAGYEDGYFTNLVMVAEEPMEY